jgi:hypothetical protein
MHGYHPSEKHSYAALFTNQTDIPDEIRALPDLFRLMVREAELAHNANNTPTALLVGFERFRTARTGI